MGEINEDEMRSFYARHKFAVDNLLVTKLSRTCCWGVAVELYACSNWVAARKEGGGRKEGKGYKSRWRGRREGGEREERGRKEGGKREEREERL